jgi:hypothetical protein
MTGSAIEPYGVLGLPRGSSLPAVRQAHRQLVRRLHPDAPAPAPERFRQVQAAYEALGGRGGRHETAGAAPAANERWLGHLALAAYRRAAVLDPPPWLDVFA